MIIRAAPYFGSTVDLFYQEDSDHLMRESEFRQRIKLRSGAQGVAEAFGRSDTNIKPRAPDVKLVKQQAGKLFRVAVIAAWIKADCGRERTKLLLESIAGLVPHRLDVD